MQWNRDEIIHILKQAFDRLMLKNSVGELLRERPAPVVLDVIDQVPQRIAEGAHRHDTIERLDALSFAIRARPARPAERHGATLARRATLEVVQLAVAGIAEEWSVRERLAAR